MARHHQSKKARMHEERGEERHLRGHVKHHGHHSHHSRHHSKAGSGYYEGADERRHQERADFSMILEDRGAVANLPQNVMYHEWPKGAHYARYELDDTIRGIDHQESEDGSGMMRHLQPGKY